eukprot:3405615-Rhodomonas_salina.3
MPLTGKELFPEKKDDDVTLALERQTSRLPPAVRAASYLSNPSSGTFINRKPQQHGNEAPNLSKMRPSVLRARWSVIKALNQTAEQAIELVDLRRFEEEGSIAHILCMSKALLLPEMKTKLFDKSVALTAGPDNPPEIHLNRGTSPAESRKRERTILWQMMHVVEEQKISFTRIGGPGDKQLPACRMDRAEEPGASCTCGVVLGCLTSALCVCYQATASRPGSRASKAK